MAHAPVGFGTGAIFGPAFLALDAGGARSGEFLHVLGLPKPKSLCTYRCAAPRMCDINPTMGTFSLSQYFRRIQLCALRLNEALATFTDPFLGSVDIGTYRV